MTIEEKKINQKKEIKSIQDNEFRRNNKKKG